MYSIYLVDYDGRNIELDTEDLDFGVQLKISSLSDLSLRSGNRTKEITLKGTQKNNNAFGYIYRLGRTSNIELDNKLFFNINSLRQVECLVYSDSSLIFRGTFRILSVERTKGVIYYKAVITDSVIDFMKYTQDRLLTDLDFSDLKHNYSFDVIYNSWNNKIQVWNGASYSYTPFKLGSGYVYPFAYYGITPSSTSIVNIYNYRPAVYVKEIINRIFSQDSLSGYTWELKTNDPKLLDKFDRLIIPNNQEKIAAKSRGFKEIHYRCGSEQYEYAQFVGDPASGDGYYYYSLDTSCQSLTGSNIDISIFSPAYISSSTSTSIHQTNTTLESDALFEGTWTLPSISNTGFIISLMERDTSTLPELVSGWNAITSTPYTPLTISTGSFSCYIPKREWSSKKQVMARMTLIGNDLFSYDIFSLGSVTASITIPYATTEDISIEVLYNNQILPYLPDNVKQYDLIKSLMLMYNLYAYVEKGRPKHIIFQTYDEFYSFSDPQYLKTVALDWTKKIIYSDDWSKVLNSSIPKSYLYTYKEDKDYINTRYKNNYSAVYGQLKFSDEYGVADEKKVELIFSPSPMFSSANPGPNFNTFEKCYPVIRGGDDREVKTTSSNIRIQYFNGSKKCTPYTLVYNNRSFSIDQRIASVTEYGEQSEYYNPSLDGSRTSYEEESLQFGNSRELFFPADRRYTQIPNLYSTYHINQVSELTDENLYTIDCKAYLSDYDISTFDFRTPIFIQTDIGNSYFKVLELSWKDYKTPATLKLQSINVDKPIITTTTTSTTTTTTTAYVPPPLCVDNTELLVTKQGYIKYELCSGSTVVVRINSIGYYTITDCHKCSTIAPAIPLADLAAFTITQCGTHSC